MSEKAKQIHNAYCDYEIAKAKQTTTDLFSPGRSKTKPWNQNQQYE